MVRNSLQASNPHLPTIKSEGKLAVIEERSTRPPGQPKFVRKANTPGATPVTSLGEEKVDAAILSQQMLREGYVQSYVDFYHLTHRLTPTTTTNPANPSSSTAHPAAADSASGKTTSMVDIALKDLLFIKNALVQAEVSRRRGNTVAVYEAYNSLADFYVRNKDHKTGYFFHEKCLEVAQLTNDIRAEMGANHSLGSINQMMANYDRARLHHEKHELLAISMDIFEEVAKANAELYKVYMVLAERLEAEGPARADEALDMFTRALEAAKKSWNKASEAEANGRIGQLLLTGGKVQDSVPYLKAYSALAADLGNAEARCRASTSLSLAYDQLQLPDKALAELTLVHSISEQAGDMHLQAQACKALGTLYSKVGRLDGAVSILTRHFQLLKSIVQAQVLKEQQAQISSKKVGGKPAAKETAEDKAKFVTSTDLDLARAYIGIAKGNLSMGAYIFAIESDLSSLLDYKLNRADIAMPAPPSAEAAAGEAGAAAEDKKESDAS